MDLKNIERDHRPMMCECCAGCSVACKHGSGMHVFYPCDAARLLARVRSLEAGLAEYGAHKPMCNARFEYWTKPYQRGCNCGFVALAGEA